MLAFVLIFSIFSLWSLFGFAVTGALNSRRNLLQSALLAPVVGMAVTVVPLALLNWLLPIRFVGPPLTASLIAFSIWLIRRNRLPIPWRLLTPFAAVLSLSAILTGYPFFEFGFNWVSFGNEDMANYSLAAKLFLNHNQWSAPAPNDVLGNHDAGLYYWYFYVVDALRHGVDQILAWVLSLTGLAPHEAFMPTILAFQLALIAAACSLVMQNRRCRRAALLTCVCLSASALITLGTVYQLFGQVGGLAMLCGLATVLLRPADGRPKKEWILAGMLLAAQGLLYPEILPFIVLAYCGYHFLAILRRRETIPCLLRSIASVTIYWLAFVNISLPSTLITVVLQTVDGTKTLKPVAALFPYYMTPAAFAYLWGFEGISQQTVGWSFDAAIVFGAVLFALAALSAIVNVWKLRPAAFISLIMVTLAMVLFRSGGAFGIYKLAMYIQPFMLGSIALSWFDLWPIVGRSAPRRAIFAVPLALAIVFGMSGQRYYMWRSEGLDRGGLVDLPFASRDRLLSRLKSLPADGGITVSDSTNHVRAKFEAAYRADFHTLSDDVFIGIHGEGRLGRTPRWNPIYWVNRNSVSQVFTQLSKEYRKTRFRMYGAVVAENPFVVDSAVSKNGQYSLLHSGSEDSVLNRSPWETIGQDGFSLTSTNAIPNRLVWTDSQYGAAYYSFGDRSLGYVSMYQPENDPYFPGSNIASLGRISLFRVLDPSPRVRMLVEFSTTLNSDGINKIPAAALIGDGRVPFNAIGRGSARLISTALPPQQVDGSAYVSLDMGSWGSQFPDRRSRLMRLWGGDYVFDNRRIVGFCRDISLLTDDQYAAFHPPSSVQTFPHDLKDKNLEFSGVYEDGWIAESSELVLQPEPDATHLIASAFVPTFNGSRTASWAALSVDGVEVDRKTIGSSAVTFNVPFKGMDRHRIAIHFDRAVALASPDNRPVSAQLRYVGFLK